MSREETTKTIPQPLLLIEEVARQNLEEQFGKLPTNVLNGLGSQDLLAQADKMSLLNVGDQQTLVARAETLLDKAQVALDLSATTKSMLLDAKQSLAQLQKTRETDVAAAQVAQQKVSTAIRQAAVETATQERRMYASITEGALQRLGYQTISVEGHTASAIQATRGHEVRVIGIDKNLNLMRDGAGLTGEACKKADERIVEELERSGIKLGKPCKSRKHGSTKGGDMLRKAGKMHAANLAAGWVSAKDGSGKSGPKSLHKTTVKHTNKMMEAS
ncbi:MAG: hypothetical protein LBI64_01390 [Coriobacteriales bacterium]|jgi:hypothetical protein|nr:hypothetical protein [Coriobacteriales bacterium]